MRELANEELGHVFGAGGCCYCPPPPKCEYGNPGNDKCVGNAVNALDANG
jgi:hypothetical protein